MLFMRHYTMTEASVRLCIVGRKFSPNVSLNSYCVNF